MDSLIAQVRTSRWKRNLKLFIGGVAIFEALYATYSFYSAKREIAFRKDQLSLPVYTLSPEDRITPPWVSQGLDKWLYRRVIVYGRPLHYKTCMVPRYVYQKPGFEYVVPLVTKYTDDKQWGLIFSKGFIPSQYKEPPNRQRVEDTSPQTFLGFVSKLDELQSHSIMGGNSNENGRIVFSHANTKDFAEVAGFYNKREAGMAVIERLDNKPGKLDERCHNRYAIDGDFHLDYPYPKSLAGALQLAKMPWDYKREAVIWSGVAAGAFLSLLF